MTDNLIGSLVAYKGKPAKVISQTSNKFNLEFADNTTNKVREKDFYLIHHNFSQVVDAQSKINFDILQDLQEELLSIKEVTEWLFNDYSAQNAWQIFLLVQNGLYFYWQQNKIFIRPYTQVENIKNKRVLKKLEAKNLKNCITNINNNIITKQDLPYIKNIEKVALNQSKHSKVLSALKINNTAEDAHKLLLKLKYWEQCFNPYPERNKILADADLTISINTTDRVDLTHLECFAIDNKNSNDADDAISIDNNRIWVHIADVASLIDIDSALDLYSQERISNLYLPDKVIHMLPPSLIPLCALGVDKISKALSIGFCIEGTDIINIEVTHSLIKISKISYKNADDLIKSNQSLTKLQIIANKHKSYRNKNNAMHLDFFNIDVILKNKKVVITPQNPSPSRDLVAEMMIIAGRAIAEFATKNNIPMPYLTQETSNFPPEILANKHKLTLAQSFQASRCFARSKIMLEPMPHGGLGLTSYLRVTSPLRRYLDLIVSQQLSGFINNKTILDKHHIKQRINQANMLMANINKTIKLSTEHFKCLYLIQNPKWQGAGVVVDIKNTNMLLIIPSLGMITQVRKKYKASLDDKIMVRVNNIDLANCLAHFEPI